MRSSPSAAEEAATAKPAGNHPHTASTSRHPTSGDAARGSSASGASSSSSAPAAVAGAGAGAGADVEDRAVRWERLQSLRTRLVDRMYRLEFEEMLHASNHRRSSAEGGGVPAPTMTTGAQSGATQSVSMSASSSSSRPIPIPVARPVQMMPSAPGTELGVADAVRSWMSLHQSRENREPHSSRGDVDDRETERRRDGRGTRAIDVDVMQRAVNDQSSDTLITLDEFLRESRDQTMDRDAAEATTSTGQDSITSHPARRRPDLRDLSTSLHDDDIHRSSPQRAIEQSVAVTVPQTAGWWTTGNRPPGHSLGAPNQETFDTFINHIRRIGNLQDAMLATMRSSPNSALSQNTSQPSIELRRDDTANISNASTSAGDPSVSPHTNPVFTGTPRAIASAIIAATDASPTPTTVATSTTAPTTAPRLLPGQPPTNTAEARLRAMQARIDILTSEFSLLRSTWALSNVETQEYERSLRRLQELLPTARRAERVRRGERGSIAAQMYDDLHGNAVRGELSPRNPWEGEGERPRERIRERNRGRGSAAWSRTDETASGGTSPALSGNPGAASSADRDESGEGHSNRTTAGGPPSEEEFLKDLLAAKMQELTLHGMR